jgi:hypothetical protein
MPSSTDARESYAVALDNPAGRVESTVVLEVQKHDTPGPLEYDTALLPDRKWYKIVFVGNQRSTPSCP